MVADCPVLVLGNKIDKYGALSDVELKEKLGINSQLTGKVRNFSKS